jgi:hypothetical protein
MNTSKQLLEQMILMSVDSYENKTVAGRFWFGCLGEEIQYSSLMELVLLIERHLEELDSLPENASCKRFLNPDLAQNNLQDLSVVTSELSFKSLAVFQLKILFRQNSSWQGIIIWVEGKQEQSFRSVLELIHLLDSALLQTRSMINRTNS